MKCKLTYSCNTEEVCSYTKKHTWKIEDYTFTDTLDLITWCSIGNIKISFDSPAERKFFENNLREDIKNYDYYLRAGKEFLRGMRECKTT